MGSDALRNAVAIAAETPIAKRTSSIESKNQKLSSAVVQKVSVPKNIANVTRLIKNVEPHADARIAKTEITLFVFQQF